jgi:hypothetical protein
LEVALAIRFLLSLVSRGEQSSILCAPDGTGASLVRYLRGFSRCAPSGIRESSRKLQIGPAVDFSQSVETELADSGGRQLAALVPQLALDTIDDEGEAAGVDVALVAGPVEAPEQLVSIEGLAAAVALDHLEDLRDRALVGGEAMPARSTLTSPADGAVWDPAGLEGPGGGVAAGAGHSSECSGG